MLTVENLHKSYQVGKTTYEVLKGVSISVKRGEFVAVMGPSGSERHAAQLHLLLHPRGPGEHPPGGYGALQTGRGGPWRRSATGSWALCSRTFCSWTGSPSGENILLPAIIGGQINAQTEARGDALCDVFGISGIREKYPAEISGGEKAAHRRGPGPDQPPAADPGGRAHGEPGLQVLPGGGYRPLNRPKSALEATIFMVTHDSFAASFCDRW